MKKRVLKATAYIAAAVLGLCLGSAIALLWFAASLASSLSDSINLIWWAALCLLIAIVIVVAMVVSEFELRSDLLKRQPAETSNDKQPSSSKEE